MVNNPVTWLTGLYQSIYLLLHKHSEENKPVPFTQVLREYMADYAAANSLKKKTIEKHGYYYNNIKRFLTEKNLIDIMIGEVKIKHMEQLRTWLHLNVKPCSQDHSSRHLRLCRSACNYAVDQEYLFANRIAGIKAKRGKTKEILYCSVEEVRKFENYQNKKRPQWNYVVELFLYQCYTGISFIDIWKHEIVRERTVMDDGHVMWFSWVTCETGRGKNNRLYWAIYLKAAAKIRNKYRGEFPPISNQVYNKTLRKIAKELGIKKHLTTHIGRKTYATLKRHEGYSIPAIAGMLGSSEAVVRKHYVHAGKELIITELYRLERQKNGQSKEAA